MLGDGEVFQVGAVAIAYTRAPTMDRLAAFRPMAKLSVTSGAGLGQTAAFAERLRVGDTWLDGLARLCLMGHPEGA